MRQPYASDISRKKFEEILPLLQSVRKRTKPTTVDLYDVFCAVLYLLRSGCRWRMLPRDFPKWRTVHSYFAKWSEPDQHGMSVLERALKKSGWRGPRETGAQRQTLLIVDAQSVLADSGYVGEPFAQGVRETLDETVTVQIAKRSALHKFAVIPKRWVVERSFAWLEKNRRLWKNCERWLNTSLQFIHLAFLAILLRRS
jgi:transposase